MLSCTSGQAHAAPHWMMLAKSLPSLKPHFSVCKMGRGCSYSVLGIVFSLSSEGVVIMSRQRSGMTPGSDSHSLAKLRPARNCPHAGQAGGGTFCGDAAWRLRLVSPALAVCHRLDLQTGAETLKAPVCCLTLHFSPCDVN